MQHSNLITAREVAHIFGVTSDAVKKWRYRGTPNRPQPVRQIGNYFVYDEQEARECAEKMKQDGK